MGTYQADMIFPPEPDFPFTIAKLCILVKYYEILNVFSDDLTIRVFLPGDERNAPTVVLPLPRSTLGAPTPLYPLEDDQERVFNLTYPLVLSPLTIKQAGFMKVRAVCGSTTTNLGSLMIRKQKPDENIQWAPPVNQHAG